MNPTGKVVSLVYALVLLACGLAAGLDIFALGFGIGDGGGHIGPVVGTFMIATLLGGSGLTIAAFGSWTRWRAVSLIAFVSALLVLPAAVLYGWQSAWAFSVNSRLGYHYGFWVWASAILPPFLGPAVAVFSWIRSRQFASPAESIRHV
jgi:hypothetical protein